MEKHGDYRIEKQGNILLVDARGPWNQELIAAYRAEMLATILALSPHPWANIVVVHGVAVMTPNAEQEMLALVSQRKKLGLTCTAMITGNADVRVVVEAQFSRIYGQAGIAYGFFEQLPQAYAWLAEQGFERLAV